MESRDQVLALFLDALGISPDDLRSFEGRKCLQKAVYLLEQSPFNRDFGFRYNLYIRGPYCPELADAGYRLLSDIAGWEMVRKQMRLKDDCAADLSKVHRAFSQPDNERLDADSLELGATAHFLWTHTFRYISPGRDREQHLKDWIARSKPELAHKLDEALERLRRLALLPGEAS